MTKSTPELDVVASFRRQLAELPELPEPRRARGVRAVATLTAAGALALLVVFAGSDAPHDALAINRDGGWLELRIADASADAEQMTRELNDAGIRGRVFVVPVAAQHAGSWVILAELAGNRLTCIPSADTPSLAERVRLSDIENGTRVLRIPIARVRESSGSFVLVAGRDARQGERSVDPGSPEAVQRGVIEPVLGSPPARRSAC